MQDVEKPRGGERAAKVWRVREFLGVDATGVGASCPRVEGDSAAAGIVVLNDAGLGFRDCQDAWPLAITSAGARPWVIVKVSRPRARGALWNKLVERHAERLIVVININDLRRGGAALGQQLSWERTASDLIRELETNPAVNWLGQAAHVVVALPTAGALLMSRGAARGGARRNRLIFDRFGVEGTWANERPGRVMGYAACMTACLARELVADASVDRIGETLAAGVKAGLCATRRLHEAGFGAPAGASASTELAFPFAAVAAAGRESGREFGEAEVPGCANDGLSAVGDCGGRWWTILETGQLAGLNSVARDIVLDGPESALPGVPIGRFGKLMTVDRREIESLLAVRAVIDEYLRSTSSNPISIAVFGPPGSGKSFAVEQVAESLMGSKDSVLKFNLTQMAGEAELIGALHQVRDKALSGKVPLVFFDEFDNSVGDRELAWLARFLAPMQDGAFQEGQLTHPIGRAVFVFAGGIYPSMRAFDRGRDDPKFKEAKGPDFVSRLKGYINVMGPDRQGEAGEDPYFVIRRAIVLRSLLQRREERLFEKPQGKGKLRIEAGVLRALLHVPSYKHGVRSMESIIAMSNLAGRTSFDRACLPPESQAELHVDGKEFRRLVEQFEVEGELLEKLARAAHEAFCEGKKQAGWRLGPRNEPKKRHPLLKDYAELEETHKESNRTTVRNIPRKLAAVGCAMIPAVNPIKKFKFSAAEVERMAELEHQLWMEERIAAGFKRGKPTAPDPRRSPHLVKWAAVAEKIKQIDRDLVRAMPGILARAGYGIVRMYPTVNSPG